MLKYVESKSKSSQKKKFKYSNKVFLLCYFPPLNHYMSYQDASNSVKRISLCLVSFVAQSEKRYFFPVFLKCIYNFVLMLYFPLYIHHDLRCFHLK